MPFNRHRSSLKTQLLHGPRFVHAPKQLRPNELRRNRRARLVLGRGVLYELPRGLGHTRPLPQQALLGAASYLLTSRRAELPSLCTPLQTFRLQTCPVLNREFSEDSTGPPGICLQTHSPVLFSRLLTPLNRTSEQLAQDQGIILALSPTERSVFFHPNAYPEKTFGVPLLGHACTTPALPEMISDPNGEGRGSQKSADRFPLLALAGLQNITALSPRLRRKAKDEFPEESNDPRARWSGRRQQRRRLRTTC